MIRTLTNNRLNDTIKVLYNRTVNGVANSNQRRYIDDYKKQHYDRINIFLPKGYKDDIKKLAESENLSVSKFILKCIESQYNI